MSEGGFEPPPTYVDQNTPSKEESYSWVWRLRPLGHPDMYIIQFLLLFISTYWREHSIRHFIYIIQWSILCWFVRFDWQNWFFCLLARLGVKIIENNKGILWYFPLRPNRDKNIHRRKNSKQELQICTENFFHKRNSMVPSTIDILQILTLFGTPRGTNGGQNGKNCPSSHNNN